MRSGSGGVSALSAAPVSRMKASDLHGGESGRLVAVPGQDVHRLARVGNLGPPPRSVSNVMAFSATRAEAHPPHARVRRCITWFRSGPVRLLGLEPGQGPVVRVHSPVTVSRRDRSLM
jgi:hypothetical protein